MQKETISLVHIIQDFNLLAKKQFLNVSSWRLAFILPLTLLALILGLAFKLLWIAILFALVDGYHLVRYGMEIQKYMRKKKSIQKIHDRAELSIAMEKLSHISTETIYEPRLRTRVGLFHRSNTVKMVPVMYFLSGRSWRIPEGNRHYRWSKEYHISTQGLENTSISGDDFIYACLQADDDIAYAYPCKNFVMDKTLTEDA